MENILLPPNSIAAKSTTDFIIVNTSKEVLERQLFRPGVAAVMAKSNVPPDSNKFQSRLPAPHVQDAPLYRGPMGTPVFSNLDLSGGSYTDNDGVTHRFIGVKIDTVLFIVNNSKNIVKTAVQGLNGTIKEYISDGDAQISIKGIIVGGYNKYPFDEVQILQALLDAPVPIGVNSYYLNNFGIYNIVIESFAFPQNMGSYSQQPFEINAISDAPAELILTGKQ